MSPSLSLLPLAVPTDIMYALEDSTCCCRIFCKAQRTSRMTVFTGGKRTKAERKNIDPQSAVMSYERPFRCMVQPCKCCCFQSMRFLDQDGQHIGEIKEECFLCVPRFRWARGVALQGRRGVAWRGAVWRGVAVCTVRTKPECPSCLHFTRRSIYDSSTPPNKRYVVAQPACCCGLCINCFKQGCCNCRIPFYIYAPGGSGDDMLLGTTPVSDSRLGKNGLRHAQITKVRPTTLAAPKLMGPCFLVRGSM